MDNINFFHRSNESILFTQTMNSLKALLDKTDVEYTERLFNTSAGIAGLGPNPFVSMYDYQCS